MTGPVAYFVPYVRAWRLLKRLERRTAPDSIEVAEAIVEYDLDVQCFFLICWHVWDWVKNDQGISPAVRKAVTDAAYASPVLRMCHDLANGTKHYTLNSPKLPAPGVRRGTVEVHRQNATTTWRFQIILPDGTTRWVDEVAREALDAWSAILGANGFVAPKLP
jgi:hypothetical protein